MSGLFATVACAVFVGLAAIWSTEGWFNIMIRTVLTGMSVWSAVLTAQHWGLL